VLDISERLSPFGLVYNFATGFGMVTGILLLQEMLTYVEDVNRYAKKSINSCCCAFRGSKLLRRGSVVKIRL